MTKSLVGALGTTATVAVAAPVTFLAINSSGGTEEEITDSVSPISNNVAPIPTQKKSSKAAWKGKKIPALEKTSDIKTKYKEIECLAKHYKEGSGWQGAGTVNNPGEEFVKEEDISKSCLIVEYYKQDVGKEGRWRGGFRFVWSISGNQQGIVNVFNSYTDNEKLIIESSVYVLEKKNGAWSLKNKAEDSKITISSGSNLNEHFPEPGASMDAGGENGYWGFNPDISKICKGEDECSGEVGTINSTTWTWTKNDDSSNSISSWSSNFYSWFQNIFQDWYQTPNQFEELKGTWTKQTQQ